MYIIVPMAGKGSRVKDFSDSPKPFIELHGKSLLGLSLQGLPLKDNKLVLVANKADYKQLVKTLAGIAWLDFADIKIELIDAPTSGQAETALIGMSSVGDGEPVLITNCDTFFTDNFRAVEGADGLLGTFKSHSPNYSYVKLEGGLVVETAEKVVISDRASAGLYYFSSVELYRRAYAGTNFVGEKYIAPMYNYLIQSGLAVKEFPIDVVIPLGTTQELIDATTNEYLLDNDGKSLPRRFRDIANGE